MAKSYTKQQTLLTIPMSQLDRWRQPIDEAAEARKAPGGQEVESGGAGAVTAPRMEVPGRGLHSSTFQLNLSRFLYTVHPKHPLIPPRPLKHPPNSPDMHPYPTESAYVEPKSGRV
jgi:hypothetical protein